MASHEDMMESSRQILEIMLLSDADPSDGLFETSSDEAVFERSFSNLDLDCSDDEVDCFELQIQEIDDNMHYLKELCNNYISEVEKFKASVEAAKDDMAEVCVVLSFVLISAFRVSNIIEQLKSTVSHIREVISRKEDLVKILRRRLTDDGLKMDKGYHQSVFNFFDSAMRLMKNIAAFKTSLGKIKEHDPENIASLRRKSMMVMQQLEENKNAIENLIKSSIQDVVN